MVGTLGCGIVCSVLVDCSNKIACFVCVCGRMIVNMMTKNEFHDFDRYLGLRDNLFCFGALFQLIVLIKLRVSVVFTEE